MSSNRETRLSISLSAWVLFLCSAPLFAEVLVLDLDGDGLRLSDRYYPVRYDLDGDGRAEAVSWTAGRQNEAFLWWDVDGDGLPDGAEELLAGFRQLRSWDHPVHGGDGDEKLTAGDRRWSELRLWIDRDHDGVAVDREISRPADWGIFEIGLVADMPMLIDGGLNVLARSSPCRRWDPRRSRRVELEATLVEVVFDRAPLATARRAARTERDLPSLPALPSWVPRSIEPGI